MRSRAQKPPPQDPSRRALSMVQHSLSLYIGFRYKSSCSYLKEIETERFCYFIWVYFFDRLKRSVFVNTLLFSLSKKYNLLTDTLLNKRLPVSMQFKGTISPFVYALHKRQKRMVHSRKCAPGESPGGGGSEAGAAAVSAPPGRFLWLLSCSNTRK